MIDDDDDDVEAILFLFIPIWIHLSIVFPFVVGKRGNKSGKDVELTLFYVLFYKENQIELNWASRGIDLCLNWLNAIVNCDEGVYGRRGLTFHSFFMKVQAYFLVFWE